MQMPWRFANMWNIYSTKSACLVGSTGVKEEVTDNKFQSVYHGIASW